VRPRPIPEQVVVGVGLSREPNKLVVRSFER
jgi:hypothetical protein